MSKSVFNNLRTNMEMEEFAQIKKLLKSPVAIYIQNTITQYNLGNFENVLKLLPKDKVEFLLQTLYSYKKNAKQYPTYENVRSLLKLYLEGLIKCITQYLELLNVNFKLQESKERNTILDDMKKLQDYIDNLQKSMRVFNPPPQNVLRATILPEHATYLRMYGYPPGGLFDAEKLRYIILNQTQNAETGQTQNP